MSAFHGPGDTSGHADNYGGAVIEEKPVETEPADLRVFRVQVFIESTLVIAVIVLSLLLLVAILSRECLRKRAFNQLLVSLAFGCFLFSLLLRPGTIIDEDKHQGMNKGYCWRFRLLQEAEWIFFPLTFWMLAIERLLALHKPETYTKKTGKMEMGLLIGFPWVFALVFAYGSTYDEDITHFGPYPDDPFFEEASHFVRVKCMMIYTHSHSAPIVASYLMKLFGCAIPVCALGITSITLIIVFFKQRGVKVNDNSGKLLVSTGSIILCLLMSISAVLIVLDEVIRQVVSNTEYSDTLSLHWAWAVVHLIFVLLALFVLPDVRHSTARICCSCYLSSKDGKRTLPTQPTQVTQTQDVETSKV